MRNLNRLLIAPSLAVAIAAGTTACGGEVVPPAPTKITATPTPGPHKEMCRVAPGVQLDAEEQRRLLADQTSESIASLAKLITENHLKITDIEVIVPDEDLASVKQQNSKQEIHTTAVTRAAIGQMEDLGIDMPEVAEPFDVEGRKAVKPDELVIAVWTEVPCDAIPGHNAPQAPTTA